MSQESKRPSFWEYCHLDQGFYDIKVINEDGLAVERPYLTLITDPVSRRVLHSWFENEALPLDQDHPSND